MFISSYIPEDDEVIIGNKIFILNYSDLIIFKIQSGEVGYFSYRKLLSASLISFQVKIQFLGSAK